MTDISTQSPIPKEPDSLSTPNSAISQTSVEILKETQKMGENIKILASEVERKTKDIESTKNLTYVGFIVLLIIVATFVINIWLFWASSYQSLTDKITQQSAIIQGLNIQDGKQEPTRSHSR